MSYPVPGMKHQAGNTLLRLETTGADQMPIEDRIQYCASTSLSLDRGDARVMYVRAYDVLNDKNSIGLHEVYAIVTPTEPKQDKYPITAHGLVP